MKRLLIIPLVILFSGCSIEIKHETHLTFTPEEVMQIGCLGGYKTVNGQYVKPDFNQLTPEKRELYLKCMESQQLSKS